MDPSVQKNGQKDWRPKGYPWSRSIHQSAGLRETSVHGLIQRIKVSTFSTCLVCGNKSNGWAATAR